MGIFCPTPTPSPHCEPRQHLDGGERKASLGIPARSLCTCPAGSFGPCEAESGFYNLLEVRQGGVVGPTDSELNPNSPMSQGSPQLGSFMLGSQWLPPGSEEWQGHMWLLADPLTGGCEG